MGDARVVSHLFWQSFKWGDFLKVKTAKGFGDLERRIRKDLHTALEDCLENEVFEAVKEVVVERVQKDVNDVYSPEVYRRRSDGNPDGGQGLGDKNNVACELEGRATSNKGKTLAVWNIAKANPRNNPNQSFSTAKRKDNILQKIIIDGWSNAGADAPVWKQPRPFTERANDAYSRDISIKVRSVLAGKRERGDFVGAYPVYGYVRDGDNRNRLAIDEYPASVVKEIFQLKLDGHSADRIAEMLNERGIFSPLEYKKNRGLPHAKNGFADSDGAKWSATAIFRILNDETYVGTLIQGKASTPNYKLKQRQTKPQEEWHRVENAHEPVINRSRFDLVQKILRLDTRTSPKNNKVYTFSGILICGCCGNRMTRKTVPYKPRAKKTDAGQGGMKYYYYFCPTGKKNGCDGSAMVKEQDLLECALESVKAYVSNIAELEKILASLDADRVAKELASNLTAQLKENDMRLSKIREFKAGLYETMINGDLSKEEHKALKAKYAEDADILTQANNKLCSEIEETLSLKHERMAWMEHFKAFENIRTIDRRAVICMIHSIHVRSKTELEITFNYKSEYENALAVIEGSLMEGYPAEMNESGKLPCAEPVPQAAGGAA